MGQSLVKNYIHIVFSTKHREPLIKSPYELKLHSYVAAICNDFESTALIVGGYTDHIHILCMLSKKLALMTLVQKIKANSSKWMKTNDDSLGTFFWQDGYGAFSVSQNDVEQVKNYIKNQHSHHDKLSFQNEFKLLLKENKVDYDERYVWD
ncbi:IS200/IS605 family transposase [Flavobacterium ardleyense]|uniref:IS200/IS605 family transposase n=1 Tax=Flavobacterium ardleyense TaxID=2038737 RepID=UPI00298CD4C5|nr:IS200/IS605 family transposase [Flavobacterium ardleyense]